MVSVLQSVPLIGLVLNYTPFGITEYSTLFSITGFILILSIISWFRQNRLVEGDRFSLSICVNVLKWGDSKLDKLLSIILIVAIAASIGVLIYAVATPKTGESFTEFYILGLDEQASDYPTELYVGEEASVILGIVNHEHEPVDYRVAIVVDGSTYNEITVPTLADDEVWEEVVSFTANKNGDNQKVEFLLYIVGQEDAYNSLHIWVNVN